MIDSIKSMNAQSSAFFNYLNSQIDIANYINYNLLELYFVNLDWPGNNVKLWRKKKGKWRWIIFDYR